MLEAGCIGKKAHAARDSLDKELCRGMLATAGKLQLIVKSPVPSIKRLRVVYSTPADLVANGLYAALATPLAADTGHRLVSLALALRALGATERLPQLGRITAVNMGRACSRSRSERSGLSRSRTRKLPDDYPRL